MYEYVKNKAILKYIFELSTNLLNELKVRINNDNYIQIDIEVVGNKNLTMRNSEEPIDVDYSININKFPKEGCDPKELKDYLISNVNYILEKHSLSLATDEVSLITTTISQDKKYPSFNLNLCIILIILGEPNRLIHRYKKKIDRHLYTYNKLTSFDDINKKVELIKEAELYDVLRKIYRNKRNLYLRQNDLENHPAIVTYIESVNELFLGLINTTLN